MLKNTQEKTIFGQTDNKQEVLWLAYGWCTVDQKKRREKKNPEHMSVNLKKYNKKIKKKGRKFPKITLHV